MRRHVSKRPVGLILIIFSVSILIAGAIYVFFSRSNPRFLELTIGTVALGVVIGVLTSVVFIIVQRGVEGKRIVIASDFQFILVLSAATVLLVAVLLYSSNTPAVLIEDIRVNTLLNIKTRNFPTTLRLDDSLTTQCYKDASEIFKNFKLAKGEQAAELQSLFNTSGSSAPADLVLIHDLMEYVMIYCISHVATSNEVELTMYRKATPRWLGLPAKDIGEDHTPLRDLRGSFSNNQFFGIHGMGPPESETAMLLPKGTQFSVIRENNLVSKFQFTNKYVSITIGIQTLFENAGSAAFLDSRFFMPSQLFGDSEFAKLIEMEKSGVYKRYDSIIFFDATFNKYRYGYPVMRFYEEWARDFLSLIRKKLAWGSIPSMNLFDKYGSSVLPGSRN